MGIIRWGLDAAGSAYRDQPKDILLAEGLSQDVLAAPAVRKNKGGSRDVLTDGSVFNVAVGQAALLIENGKVHDFVIADTENEAGQYVYDTSLEPSLLTGGGREWGNVWKMVKDRFSFGGKSPNTMNLVYINLKEITKNPVGVGRFPFIDTYLSTRLMLAAHGYYTFRISNPVVFYENLLMDPTRVYRKEEITAQLKTEMMPRIQAALAAVAPLCSNGYQDIYLHDKDIAAALQQSLGPEWLDGRGIELVSVALTPELSPEDQQRVMDLENARTFSNPDMALGSMINAQNRSMEKAAGNAAGAMNGFMSMNMAGGSSSLASELMREKLQERNQQPKTAAQTSVNTAGAAGEWVCLQCGSVNRGKFCSNCGTKKPEAQFCPECGEPRNADAKFCSNCGHKF